VPANAAMEAMFEELAGSPTFNFERGKGTAIRVGKVPWALIPTFLGLALPGAILRGPLIFIPLLPSYPGNNFLLVKSVAIKPFFDDAVLPTNLNPASYPDAEVTVNYSTPEFDQQNPGNDGPGPQPTTFLTWKVSVSGEFLVWPTSALTWQLPRDPSLDGSQAALSMKQTIVGPDVQVGIVMPNIEHQLSWESVPFPPWSQIRRNVGKVNAYSFIGAAPETLLFLGVEASREMTTSGTRMWKLEYKMTEKNNNAINPKNPYGWNHFLRPDGQYAGTFQRMQKRPPGGATILAANITNVSVALTVRNGAGFPSLAGFNVQIDQEQMSIGATGGGNAWTITARGINGTVAAAHTAPALILQNFQTVVQVNISATFGRLVVFNASSFPQDGSQFFIQVDNEKMAVTAVGSTIINGTTYGTFAVLRGVSGTTPAAHLQGTVVKLIPNGIYDLADFRTLFLSGLITG
jgi:hypothetical protein